MLKTYNWNVLPPLGLSQTVDIEPKGTEIVTEFQLSLLRKQEQLKNLSNAGSNTPKQKRKTKVKRNKKARPRSKNTFIDEELARDRWGEYGGYEGMMDDYADLEDWIVDDV